MSIITCQYCDEYIDLDYNSEHEDECEYNPSNIKDWKQFLKDFITYYSPKQIAKRIDEYTAKLISK